MIGKFSPEEYVMVTHTGVHETYRRFCIRKRDVPLLSSADPAYSVFLYELCRDSDNFYHRYDNEPIGCIKLVRTGPVTHEELLGL